MIRIATTSRQAYDDLKTSGREAQQRGRILACVIRHPRGITRRDVSRITGLEPGAVAGRVNALIEDRLLTEDGTAFDKTTHATAKLLRPVDDAGPQLELLPIPVILRGW